MSDILPSGDVPANPLEKMGYRLDFHDEFDGDDLDRRKWLPFHLSQWSSRERAAASYYLQDGNLILQITADQQPWCPEFDGPNRCSSIQTGVFAGPAGSKVGQHRFNHACVVRERQENIRTYTPQYGYFEVRAKAVNTPTNHVAFWMIGYEDSPEKSGEIAIMEIMGKHVSSQGSRVGYGVHPWSDPILMDEFYEERIDRDATGYHIYAAEWTPTHIDFFVDNRKIRTINQPPTYEMQFMLGIYERPRQADGTEIFDESTSYPKKFIVDYVRAYQPVGGYPPE